MDPYDIIITETFSLYTLIKHDSENVVEDVRLSEGSGLIVPTLVNEFVSSLCLTFTWDLIVLPLSNLSVNKR